MLGENVSVKTGSFGEHFAKSESNDGEVAVAAKLR